MNDRPHWREWPLSVFTVAVQFACGLALAGSILDWQTRPDKESLAKGLALLVFPVVAVGLLTAALHLGRPLSAWRALTNCRKSRLSQEILVVTAFALGALMYGAMWWNGVVGARLACGLSTGALGLVAVVATANVYHIPTRPGWRSRWMLVSFLGTVLLLGGLAPLLRGGIQSSVFVASTLVGSGVVVLSVVLMWRAYFKAHAGSFDNERIKSIQPTEWIPTAVYLVSASVGPFVILMLRNQIPAATDTSWIVYPAFALVVAGITLGRTAIFSMRPDPPA